MNATPTPAKPRLQIIVGSTREGRASDLVTPWVLRRAGEHGAFDVELLDLRDWPLPMFQEHMGSIGDFRDPTYSDPIVKSWNRKIGEGGAYLVITPEYNHSIPGVLKNALDNVFLSNALRNKPIACVGYSGGASAGVRAIEHMVHIAVEFEMAPIRSSVLVPGVTAAFDDDGLPRDPLGETALTIALDDLAWWANALAAARADGELVPGKTRFIAARTALAQR